MRHVISEHDGCIELNIGDSVMATPLISCCLIVTRTTRGYVYAEHCGGTMLESLSPQLFPPGDEVVESIMVTGLESAFQIQQAHNLQLQHPTAHLAYYACNTDKAPTPEVTVEADGLHLLAVPVYHAVMY